MDSNQLSNSFSSVSSMISARALTHESNKLIKMLYEQLVAALNCNEMMQQAKDHLHEINNILTDIIAKQNIVQNQNLFENLKKLKAKEREFNQTNAKLTDLKKKFNLDLNKFELITNDIKKWIEHVDKENNKTEELKREIDRKVALNNPIEGSRTSNDQIVHNETANNDANFNIEMNEVITLDDDEVDNDVIVLDDDKVNEQQNEKPNRRSSSNKL